MRLPISLPSSIVSEKTEIQRFLGRKSPFLPLIITPVSFEAFAKGFPPELKVRELISTD